jgi:DNA repair exonuclease SbcCD ATPase subunit
MSITLAPLVQQMQEKRKVLADSGVNESKVLAEKVEELSTALVESQEQLEEAQTKIDEAIKTSEAGIELAEALVSEFKAKLEAIDESMDDSDEDGEEVEIEEEQVEEDDDAEALREALSVLSAKYAAACSIIEELTHTEKAPVVDPVKESIAELVKKHPFLSESISLFESATSVEQVAKVAEVLVKTAKASGGSVIAETADPTRPKGKTVESDGASSTATSLTESATPKKTNTRASLIRVLGAAGKFG